MDMSGFVIQNYNVIVKLQVHLKFFFKLDFTFFKKRQRTGMNCSTWIDHSSNLSSQNFKNNAHLGFLTADNMGYLYHWKTKISNKT